MSTAHATSTITGALLRTLVGLSVVEACSIGQGVFGSPVSAAEEARDAEARRGDDASGHDATTSTKSWKSNATCQTCSHAPFVLKQVERMYLNGRVDSNAVSSSIVFEDPAALVEGIDEVREAFRAVQAFTPTKNETSTIERIGDDKYVVQTAMRYNLPLTGPEGLTMRSEVVVCLVPKDDGDKKTETNAHTDPSPYDTLDAGKICRIEERWNHVRLLEGFPFDLVRRGTGLVSFAATKAAIS
tara:strand:+ start:19497 stop:20225 length:729 start_codon:yes stop_codon:yes gene_type:complete